ncbi:ParB/RepB/Spo0J family partition protein [Notoacmeibacter ruber]|uniref:ParB-like N-terminal domain-containing protein n=1 Tax=Notoacmeibacter ruber TaxID=2670375 RepID=A0A3L7JDY4_9HYPH|nr:ParB N-terminal domain-containing protein [Notoacmeibacter ruber]RLQ88883.1 hypothetical protein D8780_12270 [Notoacmeibacter ruber]
MTAITLISIEKVDSGDRLRALDPDWVQLLAEDIEQDGMTQPIRVVERGDGYRLIDGARRLAAHIALERTEIEARIEPSKALADDAAIRLAEIKGNLLRGELTALDHAVYVAAWCDLYQGVHGKAKRGRRPNDGSFTGSDDALEEMSAKLALNWTEAAQNTLNISRRGIFRSLKIVDIDINVRKRIALHPASKVQRELLLLADLTPVRQNAVADILMADEPQAVTVNEAIALLDYAPAAVPVPAYERISERFSRLKPKEQEKFFELHAERIEAWMAERTASRRTKAA